MTPKRKVASMSTKKKDDRPKPDLIMRDDEFRPREFPCPRCGSREWSPGSHWYSPGRSEVTYTCWHESRGKECGFRVRIVDDVPTLAWVSPNQQWLIYDDEPVFEPDPDNDYSTAAVVEVSDGWNAGKVSISVGGKVTYDEWVLYSVPKYVRERAESMLNRKWKSIVGSKPVRSASVRSVSEISKLAADLVDWYYDFDTYGFKDAYDTWEDAYAETLKVLSDPESIRDAVGMLEEADDIDYDDDLEARRKGLLRRIRKLGGGRSASVRSGSKPGARTSPKSRRKPSRARR